MVSAIDTASSDLPRIARAKGAGAVGSEIARLKHRQQRRFGRGLVAGDRLAQRQPARDPAHCRLASAPAQRPAARGSCRRPDRKPARDRRHRPPSPHRRPRPPPNSRSALDRLALPGKHRGQPGARPAMRRRLWRRRSLRPRNWRGLRRRREDRRRMAGVKAGLASVLLGKASRSRRCVIGEAEAAGEAMAVYAGRSQAGLRSGRRQRARSRTQAGADARRTIR